MAIYAGDVIDSVLRAERRESSKMERARIWTRLNFFYFEICRKHPWHSLRRKTTLDFEDTDDGMYLPSNLFGIERVRDEDTDTEFFPRDRGDVEPDEEGFRYYTYTPETTPMNTGTDLAVSNGGTTFTATLTDDRTGYYVVFGRQPGFYLLSAIKTFSPAYYGPDLASEVFVIRPKETEKMIILDRQENELEDREVDVYYWEAPEPLYRESDVIALPISRPLELLLLIDTIGTVGKRQLATDRYRGEYPSAYEEAVNLNPSFPRASRPRDTHNQIFDVQRLASGNNSMFGTRGR